MKKKQLVTVTLVALVTLIIGGAAMAANGNFEEKKEVINEKVETGFLTQDQADEFLGAMQERVQDCDETCDGTCQGQDEGRERLGQAYGIGGFGFGNGDGDGGGAMNRHRGGNGNQR